MYPSVLLCRGLEQKVPIPVSLHIPNGAEPLRGHNQPAQDAHSQGAFRVLLWRGREGALEAHGTGLGRGQGVVQQVDRERLPQHCPHSRGLALVSSAARSSLRVASSAPASLLFHLFFAEGMDPVDGFMFFILTCSRLTFQWAMMLSIQF